MNIGMLVFPGITAIDYVGPSDLLARIPGAKLRLIWKHKDAIQTDLGWEIRATDTFESCGQLDMIVVPGGGVSDLNALSWFSSNASGPSSADATRGGID